jgi:hypothetical protein
MHTVGQATCECARRIQCVCLLVSDSRRASTRVTQANTCECILQFLTCILHVYARKANTVCIIVFHVFQISALHVLLQDNAAPQVCPAPSGLPSLAWLSPARAALQLTNIMIFSSPNPDWHPNKPEFVKCYPTPTNTQSHTALVHSFAMCSPAAHPLPSDSHEAMHAPRPYGDTLPMHPGAWFPGMIAPDASPGPYAYFCLQPRCRLCFWKALGSPYSIFLYYTSTTTTPVRQVVPFLYHLMTLDKAFFQ